MEIVKITTDDQKFNASLKSQLLAVMGAAEKCKVLID
jgi:hypothetical protein